MTRDGTSPPQAGKVTAMMKITVLMRSDNIRLSHTGSAPVYVLENMTVSQTESTAATFEALRSRLFGLAYRMLGSRAEAEDIIQDTYLRWHQANRDRIETPEAWLVTTTTRLAIDRLRR